MKLYHSERLLGGSGSGNFGHSGRPGERGGSGEGGSGDVEQSHIDSVKNYLGVSPTVNHYEVLSESEFDKRFNTDTITGKAGAITLPNNEIYIRSGSEDSGIHELVHASGFIPDKGSSGFINEGLTQVAASEIGSNIEIDVKSSYNDEVKFVNEKLIPATKMDKSDLLKQYATASNKSEFLSNVIFNNNKDVFQNEDDWGKNIHKNIESDLKNTIGTSIYLDEIAKFNK